MVVVIDPKAEFWVDKKKDLVIENPKDLPKSDTTRPIIYRPDPDFDSQDDYERVFRWLYKVKNCAVIIDEVYAVAPSMQRARMYKALLTRGRSLGIATYSATQRPRNIPVEILTESEHRFIFRLDLDDDRRRIFEATGRSEFLKPVPAQYTFRYQNSEMEPNEPIQAYKLSA